MNIYWSNFYVSYLVMYYVQSYALFFHLFSVQPMFHELFTALLALIVAYALSNYSFPRQIVEFNSTQYLGKYRHVIHWLIILTGIALVLSLLKTFIAKFFSKPLRFMVSIILPNQLIIIPTYWYLSFKNPSTFTDHISNNVELHLSVFTRLCQHFVPFVAVIYLWYDSPLFINRMMNLFNILLVVVYFILSVQGKIKNKAWPYPFMSEYSIIKVIGLHIIYAIVLVLVYEILLRIEMVRRRHRIRQQVYKNK